MESNDPIIDPDNLAGFAKGTLLAIETLGAIVQGLAEQVGKPDLALNQIKIVQDQLVQKMAPSGPAGMMFEAPLIRLRHSVELVRNVQAEARAKRVST